MNNIGISVILSKISENFYHSCVPLLGVDAIGASREDCLEKLEERIIGIDSFNLENMANIEQKTINLELLASTIKEKEPTTSKDIRLKLTGIANALKIEALQENLNQTVFINNLPEIELEDDSKKEKKIKKKVQKRIKGVHYSLARLVLWPNSEIVEIEIPVQPTKESLPSPSDRKESHIANAEAIHLRPKNLHPIHRLKDVCWERDELSQQISKMIGQYDENILLLGKKGTGKSSLLIKSIRSVLSQKENNKTFWRMHAKAFTSNTKYLGEKEAKTEKIIQDLKKVNGVVWVEDLVDLIGGTSKYSELSTAAYLRRFLQNGKLQLIGELDIEEHAFIKENLPSFLDYFQVIPVEEFTSSQLEDVSSNLQSFALQNYTIKIEDQAIYLAKRLLHRFIPYESFPGKLMRFMNDILYDSIEGKKSRITQGDVIEKFSKKTGLSEFFLKDDQRLDENKVLQFFNQQIIGQDRAVERLINLIRIFKTGLNNPNKPISTFIFTGPTGVGKTASAKALAKFFFGQTNRKEPLIRIDMSEFQFPGDILRLMGSDNESGRLVKEVKENPFSVILLDEIEKAHPSVFDNLMNMIDEGRLSDHRGRNISFKNTIIIMTSNLGAHGPSPVSFRDTQQDYSHYVSALNQFFRPEFLNRIDEILYFNPLSKEEIKKICLLELNQLRQRPGLKEKNIELTFEDSVLEFLSSNGFNPKMGARPLQRAIDQYITKAISSFLIENPQIKSTTLHIQAVDNKIFIKPSKQLGIW